MQVIIFILAVLALSFPILGFLIYIRILDKHSKRIESAYIPHSIGIFKNLNVWVKNTDFPKNKFNLDLFKTSYEFNNCDLILGLENIILIGKQKSFGKIIHLTPKILFNKDIETNHAKVIRIQNTRLNMDIIEIDFLDPEYPKTMTLVIKNSPLELRKKIINEL